MASSYGHRPFGLNDVKLVSIDGVSNADLPASRTLSISERMRSGELSGDDQLLSVVAMTEAWEWSLEAGGIDLDAWAILTGRTVATAGTSPSRTWTYTVDGAECIPYIKIYGKVMSDDCASDIHCKLWKAKMTSLEGRFQEGQFWVTSCSGIAVDDGSNGIADFVQNETAAALPTT